MMEGMNQEKESWNKQKRKNLLLGEQRKLQKIIQIKTNTNIYFFGGVGWRQHKIQDARAIWMRKCWRALSLSVYSCWYLRAIKSSLVDKGKEIQTEMAQHNLNDDVTSMLPRNVVSELNWNQKSSWKRV